MTYNTDHSRLSEVEIQLQQTKIQMKMYKRAFHVLQSDLSAELTENTILRQDIAEATSKAEKFERDYNMLLKHLRKTI
jgi:hypothetical protein